jgi:putative transposase
MALCACLVWQQRANVVGIFPNELAIRRLAGALLMEENDE